MEINNKFFYVNFYNPFKGNIVENFREWNAEKPKYCNWTRFVLNTPFFTFAINGWIFFGKKPNL